MFKRLFALCAAFDLWMVAWLRWGLPQADLLMHSGILYLFTAVIVCAYILVVFVYKKDTFSVELPQRLRFLLVAGLFVCVSLIPYTAQFALGGFGHDTAIRLASGIVAVLSLFLPFMLEERAPASASEFALGGLKTLIGIWGLVLVGFATRVPQPFALSPESWARFGIGTCLLIAAAAFFDWQPSAKKT